MILLQMRSVGFSKHRHDRNLCYNFFETNLNVETFNTKLHSVWRGWKVKFTD